MKENRIVSTIFKEEQAYENWVEQYEEKIVEE